MNIFNDVLPCQVLIIDNGTIQVHFRSIFSSTKYVLSFPSMFSKCFWGYMISSLCCTFAIPCPEPFNMVRFEKMELLMAKVTMLLFSLSLMSIKPDGSSSILLQRGLSESLAGRFALFRFTHWGLKECTDTFGWGLDTWLFFAVIPKRQPIAKKRNSGALT